MELYFNIIIFVFGAIIGSFLNVVIYRLHTGRSVNGRSHCMSCGETLRWYELFPIISYIVLRARCRSCDAYIPIRYLMVELSMGAIFLFLYTYVLFDVIAFGLYALLASFLMVIAVYDFRHTIIPDELTLGVGVVSLLMLLYHFFLFGNVGVLVGNILAGVLAGGFLWVLWFISKGRWIGLGDAKLALPLGIIAGSAGALSMVVLSFWIGALISVSLLGMVWLLKKGKTVLHFLPRTLTMKSEVPFAPFLILGFILAHFFHADIFYITSVLVPL